MDNLLFKFDQATDLEVDQNVPKHSSLYKNNDKLIKKQQQRRNEILSNRLSKRDKLIASIRRLVSDVGSDEEHDGSSCSSGPTVNRAPSDNVKIEVDQNIDHNPTEASLPCSSSTSNLSQSSHNKSPAHTEDRKFRNKAMLSEWLIERPMEFEAEWVLKVTPIGKRCLVFARKGETVAYSRTGQFIRAFQSALPGGCHMHISQCRRQFAIVDCIYVQHTNTFYLMDALAWNDQKLYEAEASFRFFWLQSKYNENQDKLLTLTTRNESRFFCLNTYTASNQDILTALYDDPLIKNHHLHLDGLLFFHIRGPYVPGANPLVLWIKPEMVNRVLNLSS